MHHFPRRIDVPRNKFLFCSPPSPLPPFSPPSYELEFFLRVVQHRGVLSWGAADASQPHHLVGFITCRFMQLENVQVSPSMRFTGISCVFLLIRPCLAHPPHNTGSASKVDHMPLPMLPLELAILVVLAYTSLRDVDPSTALLLPSPFLSSRRLPCHPSPPPPSPHRVGPTLPAPRPHQDQRLLAVNDSGQAPSSVTSAVAMASAGGARCCLLYILTLGVTRPFRKANVGELGATLDVGPCSGGACQRQ